MAGSDFLVNDQPVDAQSFVGIACDPQRSVLVEACAGSGKTWLLVARMLVENSIRIKYIERLRQLLRRELLKAVKE